MTARSWPVRATLRDGTRVHIRPLAPGDRDALAEGFRRLSARSRYRRFHTLSDRLTDGQLRYLTEIDQRDHIALAAFDDAALVGVARSVRLRGEPDVAEAAVAVLDAYQRRGLGTLLLTLLAELARERGVRSFRSYVLAENRQMLQLFEELGAAHHPGGPGLVVVDLDVPADPATLPDTAAGRAVRAASRGDLPVLDLHLPVWNGDIRPDGGGEPEVDVWLAAQERARLRGDEEHEGPQGGEERTAVHARRAQTEAHAQGRDPWHGDDGG